MAGLAIRTDDEPAELRWLARRTKNRAQALRLVAIALALEGAPRAEAAKIGAMDRRSGRACVIGSSASTKPDQTGSSTGPKVTPAVVLKRANWRS
jgi:hypothetical protein